jgi:hypothetical protein
VMILEMTPEQLEMATQFVDELIDLGVMERPKEPLKNNFPLGVVARIADGKSGGQNDICSSNPSTWAPQTTSCFFFRLAGCRLSLTFRKKFICFRLCPPRESTWGFSTPGQVSSTAMLPVPWAPKVPQRLQVALTMHSCECLPVGATCLEECPDKMTSCVDWRETLLTTPWALAGLRLLPMENPPASHGFMWMIS